MIAVAPLKVDDGWRLPRITTTNVVTQDAKATLVVSAPLRLATVTLKDCRQLSRQQSTSPAVETIEIECLSNSYQAEVELSAGIDQLRYNSASIIDAHPNEARIRYVCDITCDDGERFQLAAEISPEWIIDSVNSSPSDMLTDWEVERSGASPSRLIAYLARPINSKRSVRLVVTAQRRRAPLRDILCASDFSVLRFPDIKPVRRLAVLHTDTAHRLDVQPEYALVRLDLAGLNAADAALLGDDQPGFGFVLDERADDLEIRLVPETPDLSADMDVQATIFDGRMREAYTIACNPESNKVDQVLVHFSSARESEPEWTLNGEPGIAATHKLDVDEQRRMGLSGSGETWRLRFRAPTDQRFVLRALRSSPLGDRLSVGLASLPNATSQRGRVTVQSQSDIAFTLRHQRLRAIPPALHESGSTDRILGSFTFEPLDVAQRDSALELVRRTDERPSAWIWNCTGNTWHSLAGPIRHSALLSIETAGPSSVQLQLTDVFGEPRVLIDGSHADRISFESKQSRLIIPLPAKRRDCTVLVEWTTPSVSPGWLMNSVIQPPIADIPILARRWTLWLPPGYGLLDSHPKWRVASELPQPWSARLFGGLARTRNQDTFEPWLVHDWTWLGRRITGSKGSLTFADAFFAHLDESSSTRSWGSRIGDAWSRAGLVEGQALLVNFNCARSLRHSSNFDPATRRVHSCSR